ncbi:MAG: hypothetical protein JEY99_01180 [Spirochaetales bacterium]|nr:hypothetical protein [Spirochaetales bacterium]
MNRLFLKTVLFSLFSLIATAMLTAEIRISADTEFYNSLYSLNGIEKEWSYIMYGKAGLSFRSTGSREVKGEVALDISEAGGQMLPGLKKLYVRPYFGDVRILLGKTRTTWGAGFAFNAGDIIFGSDSISFDTRSNDPRSETAWLTGADFPLGDFSFLEIILLPGSIDLSDPAEPVLPKIGDGSAGGRVSFEAGDFNLQAGYLYRGSAIAGLGTAGQRAYISLEGIMPINWHLSASTTIELNGFSTTSMEESLKITGGASWDHMLGYTGDKTLSWQLEFLLKPSAQFEEYNAEADETEEYGLYLYPSISFIPGSTTVFTVSSIISPIDISANTTAGVSWNIYEELNLFGYYSFQTGESADIFNPENQAGMSITVGAGYSY